MKSSRHGPWHGRHSSDDAPERARGILINRGWRYDLEVWFADAFLLRGRLRELRRRVLDLARIGGDQSLLDVGCGTGTLALQAARLAPGARLAGIDPAPRPVARAQAKAKRGHAAIDFRVGSIDALPYPDASFEAVASTLMLHHLPEEVKTAGVAEISRVLRPAGRVVIADFTRSPFASADRRHQQSGHAQLDDLDELISRAGFAGIASEQMPLRRAHRGFSGIALIYAEKGATFPPRSSTSADQKEKPRP